MLRNQLWQQRAACWCVQLGHHLSPQITGIQSSSRAKSSSAGSTNAARQSRILGKLFGSRVAGTKKRWYPSSDNSADNSSSSSSYQPPSLVFQSSQFGKRNAAGSKQNTRRMSVLNKLFMTSITDLLATGQAAESVLGRSLQVSRVKISSDFACINVYWLGTGQVASDAVLEVQLQRCTGQLRHELSQLRLMGEVPRLRFVRDKSGSNSNSIEAILRNINLNSPKQEEADQEEADQEEGQQQDVTTFDVAQTVRQEFYGNAAEQTAAATGAAAMPPAMRHDVLGLDHHLIMDKILTKMRKSKSAWQRQQQHQEQSSTDCDKLAYPQPHPNPSPQSDPRDAIKFEAFLVKRRERKQTPERKKHRREELYEQAETDWRADTNESNELEPLSQKDYILEEHMDDSLHDYRKPSS
ncbi:putative ribosome-binding factor A, mitochondrial [Drosophila grimshawi]|uniref:GH24894 n=1 Tax=Drosophila grimshawi TaxID=7222 RepID=B4JNV4_DROGR|nr:putative ribosome-binding factor A, mitochondrial [Drosophila grimshawi]EDV92397.1 GH24894 [Drosophila grimshawi]